MAKTHRVLRKISGVDHLSPGDLADVTGWRNLDKLVDQRYLEKLTDAEIAAMEAAEAAKVEKALTENEATLAAARAAKAEAQKLASPAPAPAKPAAPAAQPKSATAAKPQPAAKTT